MAYCGPAGVSLHDFLNWPAYAQSSALAWSQRESERCRTCGVHPDDKPNVHAHMRQCASCGQREVTAREAQKLTEKGAEGVYVEISHGSSDRCPVCVKRRAKAN